MERPLWILLVEFLYSLRLKLSECFVTIISNINLPKFNKTLLSGYTTLSSIPGVPRFGHGMTSTLNILSVTLFTRKYLGTTCNSKLISHKPTVLRSVLSWNTVKLILEAINGATKLTEGKGIIQSSMFTFPVVLLCKARTVKALLRSTNNVGKAYQYYFLKDWLRESLLVSQEHIWRVHRKALNPTLSSKTIESYYPSFEKHAKILVEKFEKQVDKRISIIDVTSMCFLNIIIETTMGVELDVQKDEDFYYIDCIHTLSFTSMDRIIKFYYWPDFLFKLFPLGRRWYKALKYSRNFTNKIIAMRTPIFLKMSKELKENETTDDEITEPKRLCFLDTLLDLHLNEKKFAFEDVQNEVEGFLLAATETSSLAISWSLYLLGQDMERQRKVHEELDDVIGTDPEAPITLEQVKTLKYLECVIKEAMRLYPAVAVIGRALKHDIEIDGHFIRKGTNCGINIHEVHRDPDVYKDPELFNPERFLEETIDPYGFIPFSVGMRNCIGWKLAMEEMKVVLSHILRRFSVTSDVPRDKMIILFSVINNVVGGINVKFHSRNI